MRVLFDSEIFEQQIRGGISRYIIELLLAMQRLPAVSAHLLAPLHISEMLSESELEPLGFSWRATRIPRRLRQTVNRCIDIPVLNSCPHDVVHATYYDRWVRPLAASRLVVTVHDMIHELHPKSFRVDDGTAKRKRKAVLAADHVICVSASTQRDLCALLPVALEKTSVVHHGVTVLDQMVEEPFFAGRPYLLFVGHRGGYKNFLGLLRAFSTSARLQQDFQIIAFGGGAFSEGEREAISTLVGNAAMVRHVGGDDLLLHRLYLGAHCLVYPSLYEGFGMPVLEAMALSCPVVLCRSSSLPEVAGSAGEYFDAERVDGMCAAIERVVYSVDHRQNLIRLGQERSRTFTWNRAAESTLAVYRGLF